MQDAAQSEVERVDGAAKWSLNHRRSAASLKTNKEQCNALRKCANAVAAQIE